MCASRIFPWIFQSTLPVGEATGLRRDYLFLRGNFNPRFPWGKRPKDRLNASCHLAFQSTLPVGEATISSVFRLFGNTISIHASRGGSDAERDANCGRQHHFNPRFPWGKRRREYVEFCHTMGISIHASRGGSDRLKSYMD